MASNRNAVAPGALGDLDEFVALTAAVPGSLNFRNPRPDDVARRMLAGRDAGEHPSLVSETAYRTSVPPAAPAAAAAPPATPQARSHASSRASVPRPAPAPQGDNDSSEESENELLGCLNDDDGEEEEEDDEGQEQQVVEEDEDEAESNTGGGNNEEAGSDCMGGSSGSDSSGLNALLSDDNDEQHTNEAASAPLLPPPPLPQAGRARGRLNAMTPVVEEKEDDSGVGLADSSSSNSGAGPAAQPVTRRPAVPKGVRRRALPVVPPAAPTTPCGPAPALQQWPQLPAPAYQATIMGGRLAIQSRPETRFEKTLRESMERNAAAATAQAQAHVQPQPQVQAAAARGPYGLPSQQALPHSVYSSSTATHRHRNHSRESRHSRRHRDHSREEDRHHRHRRHHHRNDSASAASSWSGSSSVGSAVESSVSHPGVTSQVQRPVPYDPRGARARAAARCGRPTAAGHRRHRRTASEIDEEEELAERENKRETIKELDKLASAGVVLSITPSMDEPLWRLDHELERHLSHQQLVQKVSFIKQILKLGSAGLEWLLVKVCHLHLHGWAISLGAELDSGRHDLMLEQVYRSIWKRGAPHPWMSLALVVLGSAAWMHVSGAGKNASNGVASSSSSSGGGGSAAAAAGSAKTPTAFPNFGGIGNMLGGALKMFGGGGTGGAPTRARPLTTPAVTSAGAAPRTPQQTTSRVTNSTLGSVAAGPSTPVNAGPGGREDEKQQQQQRGAAAPAVRRRIPIPAP